METQLPRKKPRPRRPRETRICLVCSAVFLADPSAIEKGGGKYCSVACYRKTRVAQTRRCQKCDSEFYVSPSRLSAPGGGQYCSRACRSTKVEQSCKRCGATFLARSDRLVSFCSNECRKVPRGLCVVGGCIDKAWCRDMCQTHYNRTVAARIKYGLTLAQYDALKAGGCAICGVHPESEGYRYKRGLHIDHDHDTGKVRDALCHFCNVGLGSFKDDPARLRAAADYLEKHR